MVAPSGGTGGAYNKISLTKGKKYRLRIINTSLDNHFKVHLDGHNLTIIQADFVPINPFPKDWLFIAIGERYDVIITANQNVDNYWFRAEVQTGCGANANTGNINAIFSYAGAPNALPTTTATAYTPGCADETGLVPYVVKDVPSSTFISQAKALDLAAQFGVTTNGQNIVQWSINTTVLNIDWEKPTLKYVAEGNTSYPANLNLITCPDPLTVSKPLAPCISFPLVYYSIASILFRTHPDVLSGTFGSYNKLVL